MTAEQTDNYQRRYGLFFMAGLALMPLIGVLAPRFLAFWPGIIGVAGLAAYPFVFGKMPPLPRNAFLWIAGILFLAGASSLWAIDGLYALERTFKVALILMPGAALLAVAITVPLATVRPYLMLCVGTAFAGALLCAGEILADFPLQRLLHGLEAGEPVAAANLNRSVIAVLCFLFTAIGMARVLSRGRLAAGLLAAALIMVLVTQSQSAQLGFIFAVLCLFAFPYSRKKIWYGAAFILVAGVLAAPFLSIWMFDSIAAAVEVSPFFGRGDGYGSERLEIWDKVSRYALQKPFYGYGIEATRLIEDFDTQQIYRKGVTELHPHNFAVQLWIEFGVIGALAGAGFLVYLLKAISRASLPQARIALPTFMIVLSAAAFGYGLWQSWFIGLIIFTIAFAVLGMRLYEDESS